MKKFISVLLITLIFCTMLPAVSADGIVPRVNDPVGILTSEEASSLLEKADRISESYGVDVVAVINDTFEEEYLSDYTDNYFADNGFTDGFMLSVNITEGTFWTAVFGSCASFIDDEDIEYIDTAYTEAATYYDGVDEYLDACEALLSAENEPIQETVAENTAGAAEKVLLIDNADLLTSEEESVLSAKLDEMSTRLKCDVIVLTEASIDDDAEAYADDYFDYNGYGQGASCDGILFLVSMDPRSWHISGSGICNSEYISTSALDYISENVVDNLKNEEYADCFNTYAKRCEEVISDARNGKKFKEPFNLGMNLIICVAIGFVVAFIVTGSMKSQLKSVVAKKEANSYLKPGSLMVTDARDMFLYRQVTYTQKSNNSSSGSHTSSSGRSHSGTGGSF